MDEKGLWLEKTDSDFLACLRAASIGIIVFGHVGGFWFYPPWTEFLHVFVAIFFFISGAVSYNGFVKNQNSLKYLGNRLVGLLVPYYSIAVISLIIFIAINGKIPNPSIVNLAKWITILPAREISPFPIGQVWFLHTLVLLTIASPIYFFLYNKNSFYILTIILSSVMFSAIQLKYDIDDYFIVYGHNFFKPIVHSIFFCIGFIIFDKRIKNYKTFYFFLSLALFMATFLIAYLFKLNPDYAEHTFAPNIYYVTGCLSAIFFFISTKAAIANIYNTKILIVKKIRLVRRICG